MRGIDNMEKNEYFTLYPTYIEVSEDYWVCSHDVEWINYEKSS